MKLQHTWMRRLLTLVCVLAVCAIALISCNTDKTPDEVIPDNNIQNDSTTSEHEHTLVVDEAIAATCSKEGRTSGVHCSECKEVLLAQQIVSKLAHTVVIDEGVPATYEKTGLTTGAHCAICGEILVVQQVIPKLENPDDGGETPDNPGGDVPEFTGCPEVHTKANLDAKGIRYEMLSQHISEYCEDPTYVMYRCAFCNEYFADDIIPAVGQCVWEDATEPTCITEGTKICKVCSYVLEIPATNEHNYVAEIACGNPGEYTSAICNMCGDRNGSIPVAMYHVWEITVIAEPTCSVMGEAAYECTYCGFIKTAPIYADSYNVAHNWVYGEAQEGKCFNDETGSTRPTTTAGYYCEDCGVVANKGQVIIVDGTEVKNTTVYSVIETMHNFVIQTSISYGATCTTAGFEFSGCTACGYMKTPVMTPALGHEWEREGADPLDLTKFTPDATLSVKCDAANGTHGKDVYLIYCAECSENIKITVDHSKKLEMNKVVAPTCTDEGYTCNYCAACDQAFNKSNIVPANPDNHTWCGPNDIELVTHPDWYVVTTPATCTKPGVATSVCKLCGVVENTNVVVPATHHDYYTIDPVTGQIVTDAEGKAILLRPVYDCSIGAIVYTCTVCDAKPVAEKEANWKFFEDIEGFDYNDPAWHIACGGTVTKVAGDARNHAGDCENDKITVYKCDKHTVYIIYNEGKQHNIDPLTYEPKFDPTCDTPGYVGYEKCILCDYEKGIHSSKGGLIEALGHDWDMTTYVEAFEPTCTEDGSIGYGKCIREGCGYVFGEKTAEYRIMPCFGHSMLLMQDVNPDANNGLEWAVTCTKYAYNHYACARCEYGVWQKYAPATGHDLDYADPAHKPTCTEKGVLTCQNADCGYGFITYTEIVAKLPHIDHYGNEIHCVNEDFYCFECCGPIFDATTGKFTGKYTADPIDARESHVDVTTVISPNVCGGYYYAIYVCNSCGEFWNEGDMGYVDHYVSNDHWKVISVATPSAPGVEALICERCGDIVDTREIAYTGE